jgi:hypothetical protein
MRAWLYAGAAILLATSALAPVAQATEGPRAASENSWPGMMTNAGAGYPVASPQAAAPRATAPHYVWQEGYDRGGKWHGHWTLVQ